MFHKQDTEDDLIWVAPAKSAIFVKIKNPKYVDAVWVIDGSGAVEKLDHCLKQ